MKWKYLEPALLGIVLLAIIAVTGNQSFRARTQPLLETQTSERQYSTELKEIRDHFNKDRGKVRMLLLLSPT